MSNQQKNESWRSRELKKHIEPGMVDTLFIFNRYSGIHRDTISIALRNIPGFPEPKKTWGTNRIYCFSEIIAWETSVDDPSREIKDAYNCWRRKREANKSLKPKEKKDRMTVIEFSKTFDIKEQRLYYLRKNHSAFPKVASTQRQGIVRLYLISDLLDFIDKLGGKSFINCTVAGKWKDSNSDSYSSDRMEMGPIVIRPGVMIGWSNNRPGELLTIAHRAFCVKELM